MGEKIVNIDTTGTATVPVSGTNHAFEEAVQRAVDARIAQFAVALEASIRWRGGYLAESLKSELRKWAVLQGCREPKVIGFWGAEPVAVCQSCNGTGTAPHSSAMPCPICNGGSSRSAPGAQVKSAESAPLSQCCKAPTFVEDNCRRVCQKCGCTRLL